ASATRRAASATTASGARTRARVPWGRAPAAGGGGPPGSPGAAAPPAPPVQAAFLERDALQCGYCTPGQICSAVGMLGEAADGFPSHVTPPTATTVPEGPAALGAEEIRERMSGNLCRCGAYPHIVRAIEDVAP
ncbi:2Fe-2S iron-sulfur cluster-binding protein, partial [Streptomyces clavifer]|uniref:2Fe-2S iron-sulfur cluster-binding protein n=1 Tax=Streptomyces clavifer TaxID=68188 RepID=UPI00365A7F56